MEYITLDINDLLLDPNNYRFIDKPGYNKVTEEKADDLQIQKRTLSLLTGKNNENIRDLIFSFQANGFLPVDQIQVKKLANGKFLVLEGNRRTAALKSLYQQMNENALDIGGLDDFDFTEVPVVLHPVEDVKSHLVVMALKHISGNKKWPPVNQTQLIEDLIEIEEMTEEDVCDTLGITKKSLRRSRRAFSLIEEYKKSDYGDQFESGKYTLFEEAIARTDIKSWLNWDDDDYKPKNLKNQERFFSWISQDDIVKRDPKTGEEKERETKDPIITKGDEIASLNKFILDEKALEQMEESRSVTRAFALSDALGETKFNNSLNNLKSEVNTVFQFSEYMKDEEIDSIIDLKAKLDRLIPSDRASINLRSTRPMDIPIPSAHFSEITINNFRGLNGTRIRKLNRINIFAGENNSGKTSVLEAVYLLIRQNDINAYFEIEDYRGKLGGNPNAGWIERNFQNVINIQAVFNHQDSHVNLKSEKTPEDIDKNGYLSTIYCESQHGDRMEKSHVHLYGNRKNDDFYKELMPLCRAALTSPYRYNHRRLLEAHAAAIEQKSLNRVLDFIKNNIDISIEKIEQTTFDDVARFFVSSGKFNTAIDLTNYGEGVQRVFEIGLFFAYAKNGVVLIDEFESAIHNSLLIQFTRFIQQLAEEFNVQVFLTSHSKECIDAFIKNDYKADEITAYRLKEEDGKVTCKYTEGQRLADLLDSINVDIRGGKQ